MGFVAARAHHKEYGETASLLLQMAAEMGISKFDLKTVNGGFEVPDAISDVLNGTHTPPPVTIPSRIGEPPAWWGEELERPGIEVDAEGRVYLKDPAAHGLDPKDFQPEVEARLAPTQAEVRSWAEENGIQVAPKGRIAQSVIDAYQATRE